MKILRTAISGLGRIGWQYHLPEIAGHDGFELVAAADPLPERLAEVKERYGIRGYADFGELLAQEALDLMVIASPTVFHAPQAIAAFEQGVDVFLDKPMAPCLAAADSIIDSMQKHGRKLMLYQPVRATPEFLAVKAIIGRGLIGDPYMIKRAESGYDRRNDWQALKKYGGGMLNNYGAHYLDALLSLAGSQAVRISCSLRKIASLGDADDVVKALIETANGIILDMDINMAAAFRLPKWMILGDKGSIKLDDDGSLVVRCLDAGALPGSACKEELAATGRLYGNQDKPDWLEEKVAVADFQPIDYYDQCYAYYALGEKPFVPVAETREVMRVIEECRKAAGW